MCAFRLAAYVEKTLYVDEMMDRLSPEQFLEWRAYNMIEPIGSMAVVDALSMIGVAMQVMCGNKKPDPGVFRPWDRINRERSEPELTPDQARALFATIGVR